MTRDWYPSFQPFNFTFDPDTRIQNRHPILITSKDKLNFGHLTDVHVSSRQAVFRRSQAQVLQGADPGTGGNPLGENINVCFDTLKDLLDQLRDDPAVDALALTGDLIDFNRRPPGMAEVQKTQEQFSATLTPRR